MDNLHHGHDMMTRRPSSSHEATLRSVQKPPSKPWRAGTGLNSAPTPPRVYRVEPREFRDLVQRLTITGAPATRQTQRAAMAPTQPVPVRVDAVGQMYAPWRPFMAPGPGVPVHPGLDGHHLM